MFFVFVFLFWFGVVVWRVFFFGGGGDGLVFCFPFFFFQSLHERLILRKWGGFGDCRAAEPRGERRGLGPELGASPPGCEEPGLGASISPPTAVLIFV